SRRCPLWIHAVVVGAVGGVGRRPEGGCPRGCGQAAAGRLSEGGVDRLGTETVPGLSMPHGSPVTVHGPPAPLPLGSAALFAAALDEGVAGGLELVVAAEVARAQDAGADAVAAGRG